ncbi:MAG: 16S rRNA (guanine(527)-N(7))-methyltransferase RsmG [Alphaproteobacteria bacterium]|nr:16S rRNA (guanine(527)-N(7))-methyltransferase RsmG [Alphaproteobacteria bacterium]
MSESAPELFGPEEFAAQTGVSRETLARLKAYVGLLEDWNQRHNLVSKGSMGDVWRRHVWDSAQLAKFVPVGARTLADLGSGAGFPGLVLAELLRDQVQVTLYESTRKKADFLAAAAERMKLHVAVCNDRIEASKGRYDLITARALAPLDKLLGYAQQLAGKNTVCLFPKGQSLASELTEALKSWRIEALQHPSKTDPSGVILEVREFRHVHPHKR